MRTFSFMKGLVMGLTFALTALPASAQDIPNLDRLTVFMMRLLGKPWTVFTNDHVSAQAQMNLPRVFMQTAQPITVKAM